MLAYDDIDAIEYFKQRLPAYWRRNGMTMADLLIKAEAEEPALRKRGEAFDRDRAIGFALIWVALAMFAGEGLARSRRVAAPGAAG